jgi:3-oxoacyl-[acyl-carrier protein] reductase
MPHYNASKAALINLTKSLAKTYGQEGILVNAVSPAFVMTPLVEDMLAEAAQESGGSIEDAEAAFLEESRPHIVVGRSGAAEETAAVVAFLASERASFVTGSNYRVDGGSVASIP